MIGKPVIFGLEISAKCYKCGTDCLLDVWGYSNVSSTVAPEARLLEAIRVAFIEHNAKDECHPAERSATR